jgi:CRP/FNR family transcriptional regulator/CRP/FNR family cyclic AMP-dependent transcriptional regulator
MQQADIIRLATRMRRRSYRQGDIIFHKGDPGSTLYVVEQGQVKIFTPSQERREVVLSIFAPGEFFGEMALFDDQPRSASAEAATPVTLLTLQRDDFRQAIMQHPAMAIAVMAVLVNRLRHTDEMVEDAVFLDLPSRLAKKLLDLADTHGVTTPRGTEIALRLSQQDLADMVGGTRARVNEALKWYREHGIIMMNRYRFTIVNVEGLRRRI